jgi:hypothetical protein
MPCVKAKGGTEKDPRAPLARVVADNRAKEHRKENGTPERKLKSELPDLFFI